PTAPPSDTEDVTITSVVTRTSFSSTPTSTTTTTRTSPTTTPTGTQTSETSHTGRDGTSTDETKPGASDTDTNTKLPSNDGGKSLSSGAIAGIVIGALILAVGAVLGLLFWRRHKQKSQYAQKIDYAEFPEFNPSASNNGLGGRPVHTGPNASSNGVAPQPHPNAFGDPSLLRELDEA
ncbi:hypothetical protein GGI18_006292, partial [Coemansia linderi]